MYKINKYIDGKFVKTCFHFKKASEALLKLVRLTTYFNSEDVVKTTNSFRVNNLTFKIE